MEQAVERLGRGVLVVAKDRAHQALLASHRGAPGRPGVACRGAVPGATTKQLLYLTSAAVREGQEEDFNAVVVCHTDCEAMTPRGSRRW